MGLKSYFKKIIDLVKSVISGQTAEDEQTTESQASSEDTQSETEQPQAQTQTQTEKAQTKTEKTQAQPQTNTEEKQPENSQDSYDPFGLFKNLSKAYLVPFGIDPETGKFKDITTFINKPKTETQTNVSPNNINKPPTNKESKSKAYLLPFGIDPETSKFKDITTFLVKPENSSNENYNNKINTGISPFMLAPLTGIDKINSEVDNLPYLPPKVSPLKAVGQKALAGWDSIRTNFEKAANMIPEPPITKALSKAKIDNLEGNGIINSKLTSEGTGNEVKDYLKKSLNQVLLGNYTDDVTLLGTAGQLGLGLAGLDLPTDIRDLIYDLTKWKWTWEHAGQTAIDIAGLLPVIGALKYTDEAGALIKGASKYIDEVKLPNGEWKLNEAAQEYINKAINAQNKYLDKGINSMGGFADDVIEGAGKATKYFDDVQLKTEPNKAYFWSGMGETGAESAANIAKKNGGVTLETTIEAQGIQLPKWDFNNPPAIKAWQNASETYAKQVSGEVRAVIGSSVKPDSIWNMVELPTLKANPNVTKIITVDPVTQAETIIFTR